MYRNMLDFYLDGGDPKYTKLDKSERRIIAAAEQLLDHLAGDAWDEGIHAYGKMLNRSAWVRMPGETLPIKLSAKELDSATRLASAYDRAWV